MRISPRWAAIFLLASCSDGIEPTNGACPQTYEFANFGCARVQGVVRDTAGNPIAQARVTVSPSDGVSNTFDSPAHDTEASGVYSLEIHDYDSGGPQPEPVLMSVRAFLLTGSPENTAPVSDVVPVNLKFAPVGELPEVQTVDITINLAQ